MKPTESHASSPHELAQACGDVMYKNDAASQKLGMQIEHLAPGSATVSMTVQRNMLNGHKTCHGGFIFSLADSCFAFACNSYNKVTVASGCTIDFVKPALLNDVLTAEAKELAVAGRTGVYDVTVVNQSGETIACFRGKSYRIQGTVIPE